MGDPGLSHSAKFGPIPRLNIQNMSFPLPFKPPSIAASMPYTVSLPPEILRQIIHLAIEFWPEAIGVCAAVSRQCKHSSK